MASDLGSDIPSDTLRPDFASFCSSERSSVDSRGNPRDGHRSLPGRTSGPGPSATTRAGSGGLRCILRHSVGTVEGGRLRH